MSLIAEAAIFLGAAVVAVPLSKRLGLGSVLGYLLAGAAIGPWGLRLVSDVESILHFGEFGVVLLLFLIGLELQPERLWTMRRPVFGLGGAQVTISAVILAAASYGFGVPWQGAVAIGVALSLSSTAFALQIMAEKGHLTTRYGRSAFSILLFQDIAAIPIIALVPLLGGGKEMTGADIWIDGLTIAGVIAAVIVVGRYLLKFVLSNIAETGLREIFTACGLLTVVGTALLMQSVGLSMALGAFLAGVLLADSEYRHALEADIEPFKGLLLGLFFIAVGMSVNFGLLITEFLVVIGCVVGLVAAKALVLWGLGVVSGLKGMARRNLAIAISQGGEFAFVILGIAVGASVLSRGHADMAILVVTLSMAVTPLLYLISDRFNSQPQAEVPDDAMPEELEHPVIIAGFGRFGQIIGRMLRAKRIGFTALELDPNQINFVAKYGNKIYYGDSTRFDVMLAAGAREAKVLLLAVDDPDQSVRTAELVKERFPNLTVIARAKDRQHAYRLMEQGVAHVIRETFHSGIEAGRITLENIGYASKDAKHIAELFRDHDERRLKNQYGQHNDEKAFQESARAWADELEEIFAQDALDDKPEEDEAK
ncbi:MAG: cation:proton antiporter [Rhodospirillales bacterium]|nr:cation:proton antiporter [Rhodospirillales bacterium]MBO6787308.1 cation:proton antiporter [Rhodospirillales bacterium]